MKHSGAQHTHRLIWNIAICTLILGSIAAAEDDSIVFDDVQRQTKEFIRYDTSITLTPDQEAVKHEALSDLPAPCCSNYSIETCCCPCNMAKAVWGLSKFLITQHGYDATQVRETVARWFDTINPDGFSGRACYTSGCERLFKKDGCGGMQELKS